MSTGMPRIRSTDADLTDEFWAATAQHRLVRPVCDDCGRSFFTPRFCCPYCRCERWTYEQSTGRGRIYSGTVVHRGPDESWPTPYVLVVVDLDEGWNMLSRLESENPALVTDGALHGRPVQVTFVPEDRPPFRTLPAFVLVEAAP